MSSRPWRGPRQPHGELERLWRADRFDRGVGPEAVGQRVHDLERIGNRVVHRDVRAKVPGCLEPSVRAIDRDDVTQTEQPGPGTPSWEDLPEPEIPTTPMRLLRWASGTG
jgi:hypothetical protein